MPPDLQTGLRPRPLHGILRGGLADHQGGAG